MRLVVVAILEHALFSGYANRSLVLFRTQKYKLCASDIQAALFHADQVIYFRIPHPSILIVCVCVCARVSLSLSLSSFLTRCHNWVIGSQLAQCVANFTMSQCVTQDPKKEYLLYERMAKCEAALGNIEDGERYFGLSLQRLEDLPDLPEQLKSACINQVDECGI